MRKWLLFIVLVIIGFFAYKYLYKEHREISSEKSAYHISALALHNEFLKNLPSSEKKFLNKTITVSGTPTEINRDNITLDEKVFGTFVNPVNGTSDSKAEVTIKGRVIGFDELLEQVKLDQCIISNP